jgi:hypothetical protein
LVDLAEPQYHRPEARDWMELHRKSPLSQGEQKVLCHLPLFAAAAAHFTEHELEPHKAPEVLQCFVLECVQVGNPALVVVDGACLSSPEGAGR